jgi:hypothetical protein
LNLHERFFLHGGIVIIIIIIIIIMSLLHFPGVARWPLRAFGLLYQLRTSVQRPVELLAGETEVP